MFKRTTIAAVAAAALALGAAPAGAATVLGSLATDTTTLNDCTGSPDGFMVWSADTSATGPLTARADSVITTIRVLAAGGTGSRLGRIKVLHTEPDGAHWTVRAESPTIDFGGASGVRTLPDQHIRIKAGDILAVWGGDCYSRPADDPVGLLGDPTTDPAVGTTLPAGEGASGPGYRTNVEATLEPDADGDGFGDETQDSCPTDAAIQTGPCIADATITGAVTPSTIGLGDVAVLTGTVGSGSGTVVGTTLHVAPGAGLQVVASIPSAGCTFTTDLACGIGNLGAGTGTPYAIVVKGTTVGKKTLAASVAGTSTDPNAANNAVSATVTVQQQATPACAVPSLKGLTKAQAARLLKAAQCKLGKVTRKRAKTGKKGTVIKQAPKSGSSLPVGSKVAVTLRK